MKLARTNHIQYEINSLFKRRGDKKGDVEQRDEEK